MRTRTRLTGLLAGTLICALLPWSAETSAYEYVEDFVSLEYCDVGKTMALWDTTEGMIRLHVRRPQIVGSYLTPGPANAVLVDGDYAYVADWRKGLQVVDISDPSGPEIVASVDMDGLADGICYYDGKVYVANRGGFVQVIQAGEAFQVISSNKLEGGVTATPAFAGQSLLIRTATALFRISDQGNNPDA